MVELLLNTAKERGLHIIDEDQGFENTALHLAVDNGDLECVKQLLKYGTNLYSSNFQNCKVFHRAVYKGYDKIVKVLLEYAQSKGNNIVNDIDTSFRSTALEIAVNFNHPDVVKELLAGGADLNIKTLEGKTIFECNKNQRSFEINNLLNTGANCDNLIAGTKLIKINGLSKDLQKIFISRFINSLVTKTSDQINNQKSIDDFYEHLVNCDNYRELAKITNTDLSRNNNSYDRKGHLVRSDLRKLVKQQLENENIVKFIGYNLGGYLLDETKDIPNSLLILTQEIPGNLLDILAESVLNKYHEQPLASSTNAEETFLSRQNDGLHEKFIYNLKKLPSKVQELIGTNFEEKAKQLTQDGHYCEALELYSKIPHSYSKYPAITTNEVIKLTDLVYRSNSTSIEKNFSYSKIIDLYDETLNVTQDQARVEKINYNKACIFYRMGPEKYQDAIKCYKKVDNADSLNQQGILFKKLGKFNEAKECFEKLLTNYFDYKNTENVQKNLSQVNELLRANHERAAEDLSQDNGGNNCVSSGEDLLKATLADFSNNFDTLRELAGAEILGDHSF